MTSGHSNSDGHPGGRPEEQVTLREGMEQGALFDFAMQERPGVISLALGLPNADFFPLKELRRAAARVFDGSPTVYQYENALDRLKRHVVDVMAMRGVACDTDEIILTNGAQDAIDIVVRLLHRSGQAVVVEEVTYPGVLSALATRDAKLYTLPVDLRDGFSVEALRALLESGVAPAFVYVMPEGHNPLGVSMPPDARRRLLDLGRERGFYVIEDDAYGFLQYDGNPELPLRATEADRVIYVGSFSKILCPGLRVGWFVVPRSLARAASRIKEGSSMDVATPGQHLVASLLDAWSIAPHIATLRSEYATRRDAMGRSLKQMKPQPLGTSHPRGGMFYWLMLPPDYDTQAMLRPAIERYGVSFVPGDIYYADDRETQRNYLRLCFASVSEAEIEQGIVRLAALCQEWPEMAGCTRDT